MQLYAEILIEQMMAVCDFENMPYRDPHLIDRAWAACL
jgi:hypothetical protein